MLLQDRALILPKHSIIQLPKREGSPVVVLAKRKEPETRIWENVEDLALELRTGYGMRVEVVSLGELPFPQQVSTISAADVLVGITGSDLVNLMFLPPQGSVIEIFPSLDHQGVFIPELGNMAKMLGKNHFSFVSDGNITVDEGEARLLYRTKYIRVAVKDLAALVHFAVHQSLHGSSLMHTGCIYNHVTARCAITSS